MNEAPSFEPKFYGSTTLGEKGQVVIPAEARTAMNVGKGEKLLVFGMGADTLMLSKATNLERMAAHLAHRLESLQSLIETTSAAPKKATPNKKAAIKKNGAKKKRAKKKAAK